uniref:Ubiquitin-like-conjugating enzyme ATG3 n=1 Tax=Plectus sambesii TaxID=2011161 RepID=A0A914W9C5_9BILA
MEGLVNSVKSAALGVGEFFTPVLKESKFKELGVLTPEEFVIAGDHLVHHCPTWSWAKASDSAKVKPHLPEDKQFLITKNVPCYRRCRQLEYDSTQEKILGQEDLDGFEGDGEGWVDTHHFAPEGVIQKVSEMRLDAPEAAAPASSADDDDDEDAPAMDMEDFVDDGRLEEEDPNALVVVKQAEASGGGESTVVQTRTYDLHITYDKYYQVPRLWLVGYNEQRKHLSVKEMYEDFSADHANKTITMETHPHLNCPPMASVHPCRHAEVMKRLIEQLAESGRELGVHQYLLIFLKFVQAVIPTIEYDYTRSIQL